MDIPNDEPVRDCCFRPEGEMTIYTAAEIKERLLDALSRCPDLEINLSQVGEIDTAGLQLLILAAREAQRRSGGLHIVGHSAGVREVLDLCSLSAVLGDPVVIPSDDSTRRNPS